MASIAIDRTDGLSSATAIKGPVRVATTANIALTGLQTIDGVSLAAGDRVLVKNQTTASESGIYVVDTGPWRRAKDFAGNRDVKKGTQILVTSGTLYASSGWYVSTADPIVIGTTAIQFTQNILLNAAQLIALEAAAGASADAASASATAASNSASSASASAGAAEAARDTALAAVPNAFPLTRTALKALDTATITSAYLKEQGREGQFVWDGSDLSSRLRPSIGASTSVAASEAINGYTASHVITIAGHKLFTGCPVTPATSVNGLTAGTTYYVIKLSADKFSLASSLANAFAYTVLALSGTTNFTLRRIADLNEAVYVVPNGLAADGSAGAWVRVQNYALARPNVVSLPQFGAVGDGVTDDSQALYAAGVFLSAGLASALYVPKGTYFHNDSSNRMVFDHIVGLHVYGDGWASKILFGDSAGARPLAFRYNTGQIIEKLWFDSTGRTTGTWDNLSVANCSGTHFRFNRVTGAAFYGLGGYGDNVFPDAALYIQEALDDFNVYRNFFENCGHGNSGTPGYGVEIFPNVKSYRLSIEDNFFSNCGGYGGGAGTAACKGGSAYEGARIARNFIYDSPASGIHTGTFESVEVEWNTIFDFGQANIASTIAAIAVSINDHPFYGTPAHRSAKICDNIIDNVTATAATLYGFSINGNLVNNGPVDFERNKTFRVRGILMRSSAAVPLVGLKGNEFGMLAVGDPGVFGDAASGAALPGVVFEGNKFWGTALNRTTTAFVNLTGFTDAKYYRNRFTKGGNIDVALTNCGGSIFDGNIHEEPNVSNTSGTACINIADTSVTTYTLMNEEVIKGVAGNPKALYTGNSANPTVRSRGNRSDTLMLLQLNATPNLGGDWIDVPCPELQIVSINGGANLTPFVSAPIILHTGTLTADRAITLLTTGAVAGKTRFRITRTGGGAFNLNVGTGPLKALTTNTWCEVVWDGSAYYLAAYGAL